MQGKKRIIFKMKLFYATRKVERILKDDAKLEKFYGQLASAIKKRIHLLRVANNLAEAMEIPSLSIHLLKGDRRGKYAVKLDRSNRMIVVPCCGLGNPLNVEQTNPKEIIALVIETIAVDYH